MLKRMPPRSKRTNDPERTRRDILEVAMAEFASEGYSGARVDAIAARTRTSKRMIYYYFGGKEQLYLAVLEEAYRSIRALEEPARHRQLRRARGPAPADRGDLRP